MTNALFDSRWGKDLDNYRQFATVADATLTGINPAHTTNYVFIGALFFSDQGGNFGPIRSLLQSKLTNKIAGTNFPPLDGRPTLFNRDSS